MKLAADRIAGLAEQLEQAQLLARAVPKITDAHPEMDWDDAYAIQDAIRAAKLARGDRLAGLKAGLTSQAKMQQMGVTRPVFGFLCESFAVPDGGSVRHAGLIHPKVEPEIALVLKDALRGPDCQIATVLAATAEIRPAIEVIDSRYRDFKFDLKSVVADNTSAACFVLGRAAAVGPLDLPSLEAVLTINGEVRAAGTGAAVLGHPAASVAMLANFMAERGQSLPAGSLILTGGITEALAVQPGDQVSLRIAQLGSCSIAFS